MHFRNSFQVTVASLLSLALLAGCATSGEAAKERAAEGASSASARSDGSVSRSGKRVVYCDDRLSRDVGPITPRFVCLEY